MKINKKNIVSIIYDLLIIGLILFLGISIYYNYILQNQIEERDKIIYELSTNSINLKEKLLDKFFHIEYDSISSVEIFTLKDDYLSTEHHNKIIKNITRLDSIEYTNLIQEYNKLVHKYNDKQKNTDTLITNYNTLIAQYNTIVHKYNKQVHKTDSITSIMENQKIALDLIEKSFDIKYVTEHFNNKTKISLLSEKADSAFLLLPYFRDRLQYDSLKKCWEIKIKQPFWK